MLGVCLMKGSTTLSPALAAAREARILAEQAKQEQAGCTGDGGTRPLNPPTTDTTGVPYNPLAAWVAQGSGTSWVPRSMAAAGGTCEYLGNARCAVGPDAYRSLTQAEQGLAKLAKPLDPSCKRGKLVAAIYRGERVKLADLPALGIYRRDGSPWTAVELSQALALARKENGVRVAVTLTADGPEFHLPNVTKGSDVVKVSNRTARKIAKRRAAAAPDVPAAPSPDVPAAPAAKAANPVVAGMVGDAGNPVTVMPVPYTP